LEHIKEYHIKEETMADLTTTFCGIEVKNPVGVTSCDYGGVEKLIRRVGEQGIGWIIGKTVHKIDGPHRWPRPFFYSLRHEGNDMKDVWICSQMFHNMEYERWLDEELPKCLKTCEEMGILYIASCSGTSAEAETWIPFLKDLEERGCKMIELDTGGPHATFGAIEAHKDVGAPLALDPDTAYKVTKACVDAVNIPIMFKTTPQCVNAALVALAIQNGGGHAISGNNAFYGAWIDADTNTFYGVPGSMGGLMGRPWQIFSLAKILETTATIPEMPFLGGGGVFNGKDVARHLLGGCDLVGMCSAVYSRGVGVLSKTIAELENWMDEKGYKTIKDIPVITDQFMYLRDWKREGPYMQDITPVIPEFDEEKCNQCGICENLCPYGAISLDKDAGTKPTFDIDKCYGCGWCVGHCPQWAVKMVKRENGDLIWNGKGVIKDWVSDEEGY